jgi:hypothetical protein
MFNIAGDRNWRHNIEGAPQLIWFVGQMFLFGLFWSFGIIDDARKALENGNAKLKGVWRNVLVIMNRDCFPVILLVAWFLICMLPVVLSDAEFAHALRAILMLPPVIIFAALGGRWLYQKLQVRVRPAGLKAMAIVLLAFLVADAYRTYFVVWAHNPEVPSAFSSHAVQLGRQLNALPPETPKYVIVQPLNELMLVRGIPISALPTMFVTDTFGPEEQKAKNIHYVLPADEDTIPEDGMKFYLLDGS